MRNLLRFLLNYQFVLLFVILETIAITLVVKNNNYQGAQYNDLSYTLNGYIAKKKYDILQYLSLREVNNRLAAENALLKNELEKSKLNRLPLASEVSKKTLRDVHFSYVEAKVVFNSVNKQYNYIILNKGLNDSIKPDMAVVCPDGIVGVVESVSDNYSSVISLLNRNLKVSAKFRKNNYFGSFEWPGNNFRIGELKEIPLHVYIQKGDTIVTSGYSSIFPENIAIGYVQDFKVQGGSFFEINLQLSTDFKNLSYVYVVKNNYKEEINTFVNVLKND